MKFYLLRSLCLLALSLCLSCRHKGNIKITVSENENSYRFTAWFNEASTRDVQRVINRDMEPNGLFASSNDVLNVTTTLHDKTTFHIKASRGNVEIDFDKNANSYASYLRIKHMGEDIKNVLRGR